MAEANRSEQAVCKEVPAEVRSAFEEALNDYMREWGEEIEKHVAELEKQA